MFKIFPSDAIVSDMGGFPSRHYPTSDWWMTYEHFCRKFLEWCDTIGKSPYEVMTATSSINNGRFYPLHSMKSARDNLVYLFQHAGQDYRRADFLRYMGIKNWNDLSKPVAISGWRPEAFPHRDWFFMPGRVFKKSPNSCHKKAKWVMGFSLQFCSYNKRWRAIITYGYPHDCSSWDVTLEQNHHETLNNFAIRVDKWVEGLMIPESDWCQKAEQRSRRVGVWYEKRNSLKTIFRFGDGLYGAEENALTDNIMAIQKGASLLDDRIHLNKSRYGTLARWAKSDAKNRKNTD